MKEKGVPEIAWYQMSMWYLHHSLQLIKALVMVYEGEDLKARIIALIKECERHVPVVHCEGERLDMKVQQGGRDVTKD